MDSNRVEELAAEAEVTRKLALVAIEMVLTLGIASKKGFDLRAYANVISGGGSDGGVVPRSNREVAQMLRNMADAMDVPAAA